MRSSNKSRNRNRNNRRVPSGNIVNRVFESAGPEGKVRGTPQQVIEKYSVLAHDAQLSGDRVAAENFMQHSEHYNRMLSEAQKEIEARQETDGSSSSGGSVMIKDRPTESTDKDVNIVESEKLKPPFFSKEKASPADIDNDNFINSENGDETKTG